MNIMHSIMNALQQYFKISNSEVLDCPISNKVFLLDGSNGFLK